MTNLEKAVELSDRKSDDLYNNECPINLNILPRRMCDEQCDLCWEEEFYMMFPECWNPCTCAVCQEYEKTCCKDQTEECKDKCILMNR